MYEGKELKKNAQYLNSLSLTNISKSRFPDWKNRNHVTGSAIEVALIASFCQGAPSPPVMSLQWAGWMFDMIELLVSAKYFGGKVDPTIRKSTLENRVTQLAPCVIAASASMNTSPAAPRLRLHKAAGEIGSRECNT